MNVRQLMDQLSNYPPESPVLIHVMTGDGAATVLETELVVDASKRHGATGGIADHRCAIRTALINAPIRPMKVSK